MNEALTLYEFDAQPLAISPIPRKGDYQICLPGGAPQTLRRDVDFGMIRKKNGDPLAKHPTLFKSGAEKVAVAYGLCQRYELVSKIENIETGFFYFLVRCDLVKIVNGAEYVITSAYGSGNTREGRSGSQSPYDGANSAVKMAQKRALVAAALSLGALSDAFTQDLESDWTEGSAALYNSDPNAPITANQVRYFYTIATRQGVTKQQAKAFLSAHGYSSAKAILQKDFDALCEQLAAAPEQEDE